MTFQTNAIPFDYKKLTTRATFIQSDEAFYNSWSFLDEQIKYTSCNQSYILSYKLKSVNGLWIIVVKGFRAGN